MTMVEKLESKKVYEGKIIDVYSDKVKLENGRTTYRDVVRHRDAAAILAIDDENQVLIVKQYRSVGKGL